YDSERLADILRPLGYAAVEAPETADLVVLNTCHIREKASEKLYSDLGRLRLTKRERGKSGETMQLAVAGCVAQAEGAEIIARIPEVDFVVGPQAFHRLPEMLARSARERGETVDTDFAVVEKFDRLAETRTAKGPAAFLTIQEGCDKFCTFCVVPYTRGAEVSRGVAEIVAEAERLADQGVREITLLGQNVNAWRAPADGRFGTEIAARDDGSWGLGELCRALARIDGVARLRFTTSHPRDMDDGLVRAFGDLETLMPYLHLPVQSGDDAVLDAMNRGHTRRRYIDLVAEVRAARPDIALSSDFIVGFPGESDDAFAATLDLVERVGFASAFAFKYSRRPGTPAAVMAKQVAEPVKDERLARLLAALDGQRADFNKAQIGRALPVLFEKPGRNPGQLVGRSPYLQSVHATAPHSVLGLIKDVRIVGVTTNALSGELTAESAVAEASRA
ncbi:MAG: tRNA (N6-isopentenyl adenosine(37)-C2)-methylthiotransferase MiaB, partial [Parvularculaceae bacterium]|nr:tRNA (N6-isopentenyl adenosine(37)-C2)-methylthiotransferase MiaB [Parvularculaceae bacterium]